MIECAEDILEKFENLVNCYLNIHQGDTSPVLYIITYSSLLYRTVRLFSYWLVKSDLFFVLIS